MTDEWKGELIALAVAAQAIADEHADVLRPKQTEQLYRIRAVIEERMLWRDVATDPPCAVGEQADVMFCAPGWGWPIVGVVTRFTESGYDWLLYDQENDKFLEWLPDGCKGPLPTLWLPMPVPPKGQEESQ
jgi:hypothetical protein